MAQDELQIRKDALAKCQTDVVAMQSAIQSLESEAFVHVQQLEREREQLLGRLEVAERAVERGANMHDVLDAARSAAEVRAQNAEEHGAELGRELAEAKEEAASSAAQVSSMHARLQSLEKAEQGLLAKVSALEEMGEEANAVADRAREQVGFAMVGFECYGPVERGPARCPLDQMLVKVTPGCV